MMSNQDIINSLEHHLNQFRSQIDCRVRKGGTNKVVGEEEDDTTNTENPHE